jgi:hypothetical protein
LPNKRSEYWDVIYDINKVLNIKIKTMTVFALLMLMLERKNINFDNDSIFYADKNIKSYREEVVEKIIGKKLEIKDLNLPQIDIVK